jgi:hypothetical protein
MASHNDPVDRLRVASPCPTNWEQMSGDDRVRFCELCNLHVYNISRMTRKETEALITNTEGRICARLYRRSDGTIITKDCPVGLRAIRRRAAKVTGAVFATVVSLCGSIMGQKPNAKDQASCGRQVTISRKVTESQTATGVIAGTVFDPLGAVVAGARVIITDPKSGKTSETESSTDGRFQVSGLPAGIYDLTITSASFKSLELKQVTLGAKETVTLDLIVLAPEVLTGVVVVITEPSLLDKGPSNKVTFSGDMLRRLPH